MAAYFVVGAILYATFIEKNSRGPLSWKRTLAFCLAVFFAPALMVSWPVLLLFEDTREK